MGLDFTHDNATDDYPDCCPRWGYMGFMRFRTRLAAADGITLADMDGFSTFGNHHVGRKWSEFNTALKPLLDHSDCDGELTPAECAQVAPRLREIVQGWPEDDRDRQKGLRLADCMDRCAGGGVNLEFC